MVVPVSRPVDSDGYWKVAIVDTTGKREWRDYIPVQAVGAESAPNANRHNASGYVEVNALADVSALDEWRDYTPVGLVTGRSDAWNIGHVLGGGYIPVFAKAGSLGGLASYTFSSSDAVSGVFETDASSDGFAAALAYDATYNGLAYSAFSQTQSDNKVATDTDKSFDATNGFDCQLTVYYNTLGSGSAFFGAGAAKAGDLDTPVIAATVLADFNFNRIRTQHYDGVTSSNPTAWDNGSNIEAVTPADDAEQTIGFAYDPNGNGGGGTIAYYYNGSLLATYNLTTTEKAFFTATMHPCICAQVASGHDKYIIRSLEFDELGAIYS